MRYKEAYDYFYQVYSSRLDEKVNILFKPGEGISTFREVINFSNIFYDNVNRIEQLRETNYNSQPIEELVKLSKEIQPLENACQELYQYNSSIPEQEKYELLATKILDVSNRMDDGFISIVNHVKDKFEERYNLLKLMDKSELEIIGDLREELSSLISKYNSLEGIFEERNIDNIIISNIKESFSEYVENKRNIELIDSDYRNISIFVRT